MEHLTPEARTKTALLATALGRATFSGGSSEFANRFYQNYITALQSRFYSPVYYCKDPIIRSHHIFSLEILNSNLFKTSIKLQSIITINTQQIIKMQFTNAAALACALLSSISLAAPAEGAWKTTATIQLANDQSGANANVAVPVDGVKRSVQELWGHTSVAKNGLVFASSTQLVAFQQTTVCTITEEPRVHVTLDAQKTWASFGGGVVDLCSAYVVCKCEGM